MSDLTRREHEADLVAINEKIDHLDTTSRERLEQLRAVIEEKFKSLHSRMILYIGAAVGIIRFDLPKEATGAVIGAVALKGLVGLFFRH